MYLCIKDNKFKREIEENCVKIKDGIYFAISTSELDNNYVVISSENTDISDNSIADGSYIGVYIIKKSKVMVVGKLRKESGVWQKYGTEAEYREILGKSVTDKEYEEVNKIINNILYLNNVVIDKNKVEIKVSYLKYNNEQSETYNNEVIEEDEFGVTDMAFGDISTPVASIVEKVYSTSKMKFSTIINEIKQLASNGLIDRVIVTQDNTYLVYADDMMGNSKIKVSTFGDIIDTFVKIYEMNKEG